MTSSPSSPTPSPSPEVTDSLHSFSCLMRAARSEISDINRRLDLVAQTLRAGERPDAHDALSALELLRGVQGTVESMVGSMAAMSEALHRIEARHAGVAVA